MGDDLPDIPLIKQVGLSACPNDASSDVLAIAEYISPAKGGHGAVRDVIERIMRCQDKWPS
jgi:3-deoxy-D-manno-octulosonate 8-phosphate phosphatase (KDO 8-P phosphatase)